MSIQRHYQAKNILVCVVIFCLYVLHEYRNSNKQNTMSIKRRCCFLFRSVRVKKEILNGKLIMWMCVIFHMYMLVYLDHLMVVIFACLCVFINELAFYILLLVHICVCAMYVSVCAVTSLNAKPSYSIIKSVKFTSAIAITAATATAAELTAATSAPTTTCVCVCAFLIVCVACIQKKVPPRSP